MLGLHTVERNFKSSWDKHSSLHKYCITREYYRGKYHCTIDLLFDWFGMNCMTTDIFVFYLQNRIIQTSQIGGQQYKDTSLFSIPWYYQLAYTGLPHRAWTMQLFTAVINFVPQ
jgi:hypothetical protein